MASYNESKDFPVDFPKTSKMCAVYIPGIVYVPLAILETIQITWSKQLTDQGYPIWAKCNCQFTGAYPAVFEDNFLTINPKISKSGFYTPGTENIQDVADLLSNVGVSM